MRYLLIGGAETVGKTGTIIRLTDLLISKGYSVVSGKYPSPNGEVRIVLEGKDANDKTIKILINSATDTYKIIKDLKRFIDNNLGFDILVSSVRDEGSWPRKEFFSILNINKTEEHLIEIPLAKITRRKTKFPIALSWYEKRIDKLIALVITSTPFNLWK